MSFGTVTLSRATGIGTIGWLNEIHQRNRTFKWAFSALLNYAVKVIGWPTNDRCSTCKLRGWQTHRAFARHVYVGWDLAEAKSAARQQELAAENWIAALADRRKAKCDDDVPEHQHDYADSQVIFF